MAEQMIITIVLIARFSAKIVMNGVRLMIIMNVTRNNLLECWDAKNLD